MEDGQIPKDVLHGKLASGKGSVGRPQLRYKDVCKRNLKALDMHQHRDLGGYHRKLRQLALLAQETTEHR